MNEMLAAIEKRRQEAGIPVSHLERLAGLSHGYYWCLINGRWSASRMVIQRLRRAVARLADGADASWPAAGHDDAVVRVQIRLCELVLCAARGLDSECLCGQESKRRGGSCEAGRLAAGLRNEAWAVINNALAVRASAIARAAGVSKAAVSLALKRVEDRREDDDYDRFLSRIEQAISEAA